MKANAATMSRRRMLANTSAATSALRGLPAAAGRAVDDDPVLSAKGFIDDTASDREILTLYAERNAIITGDYGPEYNPGPLSVHPSADFKENLEEAGTLPDRVMNRLMNITSRITLLPATSLPARRAKIEVAVDDILDSIDRGGVLALSLIRDLAGNALTAEQRKKIDAALDDE